VSRLQRKIRRRAKSDGYRESHAARSSYAAKKWTEEHGTPPDPEAYSKARTKTGDAK
jgi:hypothetical protein